MVSRFFRAAKSRWRCANMLLASPLASVVVAIGIELPRQLSQVLLSIRRRPKAGRRATASASCRGDVPLPSIALAGTANKLSSSQSAGANKVGVADGVRTRIRQARADAVLDPGSRTSEPTGDDLKPASQTRARDQSRRPCYHLDRCRQNGPGFGRRLPLHHRSW